MKPAYLVPLVFLPLFYTIARMTYHLAAALLATTVLTIGCAAQSHPSPLQDQFDEDWKYWMAQYPEAATAFGYPGQNARWTDYCSRRSMRERII